MASTKSPETLWLYSDQRLSWVVRGASLFVRSDAWASSVKVGVESVGHLGVKRNATSARVARSAIWSTAGGVEPSAAARKSTVTAPPTSTSTSRRRVSGGTSASRRRRRTAKKLSAPRPRRPRKSTPLVKVMAPYAVPRAAPGPVGIGGTVLGTAQAGVRQERTSKAPQREHSERHSTLSPPQAAQM